MYLQGPTPPAQRFAALLTLPGGLKRFAAWRGGALRMVGSPTRTAVPTMVVDDGEWYHGNAWLTMVNSILICRLMMDNG